jgi:hypothetical protein
MILKAGVTENELCVVDHLCHFGETEGLKGQCGNIATKPANCITVYIGQ